MKNRRGTGEALSQEGAHGAAYTREDPCSMTVITGVTGDQVIGAGPVELVSVRVGGVAALTGAVVVKDGATSVETIPSAAAIAAERTYRGATFNALKVNMAQAADTVLVFWRAA